MSTGDRATEHRRLSSPPPIGWVIFWIAWVTLGVIGEVVARP